MKEYIKWFKIYTSPQKECFYKVYIFDDWDKMYTFCDRKSEEKIERNYNGLCHSWIKEIHYEDGTIKIDKDIGFIALHKDELTAGVTSHECAHATTYYIKHAIKYNLTTIPSSSMEIFSNEEADEHYAWTLGYLVSQLINKIYKSNII